MTERTKENLNLTPRLQAIADRVPQGAHLVDVGTDHGHLPLFLLRENRIACAIASDIRQGPLNHAKENARFHQLEEKVTFCLAAGLEGVQAQDCDTISIAGMGGQTMIEILKNAPWTSLGNHKLLLQPMTMLPQLRQWLWANGYRIEEETVCPEGKRYYLVWSVWGGGQVVQKQLSTCYWSQPLLKAQGAKEYLSLLLKREQKILLGMERGQATDTLLEQQQIIAHIEKGLEELKCQL